MKTISIVARRSCDRLQQRLEQKGAFLNNLPYRCCWSDCGSAGKMLAFIPGQTADRASRKALGEEIASLVAHFIIEDLKVHLLHDLLRFHYFYFGKEEHEEILDIACRNFESAKLDRRREIHRELIEKNIRAYLNGAHDHMNIEGFYNFRLHDCRCELRRVIDEAVESHLAEREYREFVRLLKYFLNLQQPKIDLIHLSVDQKGRVRITDHRFRQVDPCDWEEFDLTDFDEESDYEDILVSMLVSVARAGSCCTGASPCAIPGRWRACAASLKTGLYTVKTAAIAAGRSPLFLPATATRGRSVSCFGARHRNN